MGPYETIFMPKELASFDEFLSVAFAAGEGQPETRIGWIFALEAAEHSATSR